MINFSSRFAAKSTKVALLLAVTTSLAGCSMESPLTADDQYVPQTPSENYPIKVVRAPIKMDISSQHRSLQPSQINAIAGFARSANNSGASKIVIRRPSGGGASRQVASQTYQLLIHSGISPGMISQATYPGSSKAPVQLSYVRAVAVTRECGNWSQDMAFTYYNEPYTNFGCAAQNNIAAMVVNPKNFEVPEVTTPVPAEIRMPTTAAAAPAAAATAAPASP
jgi:pilus assembly protein CpaD